ncbi:MAG TPA: serine/threonine-protein kinase [Polyangia bacterium]|nr:serine/threonine-protein kinase [Polyangia bacterium]
MQLTPSADRCPRCGRPAHGSNGFDCPVSTARGNQLTSLLTPVGQGLQIGEYAVEDKIGAGGMGVVYKASHGKTGKRVAIKVLSGVNSRDANAVRRFILEIRTLNQIHHPNLVNILSFGQLTDGRYYYVMEYLEGCSLGALIRGRGRLRPEEALPVFLDVCKALEVTHAKGIVHRDLKPDNVFLVSPKEGSKARRAKLLDFGLAKLVEDDRTASPQLTAAGMAVGTPQYMAPEQCKAQRVDARTDLYALGIMLYEALTGTLPFDGPITLDIWEAHVRHLPRSPAEISPDTVSTDLESIIMTLLAKRPDERFQSAAAVAAALSSQLEGPENISLDVARAATAGASASDVARAIPSSINSMHMIPLGGGESQAVAAGKAAPSDPHGLRQVLDADANFELEIAEPARETDNPAQASALDIDLEVQPPPRLPAWATRGGSSGRLTKVGPPAKRPERKGRGGIIALVLLGLASVGGALGYLLLR